MHLKQRYPHLQVVLSIGGPNSAETFPIVASDAILRDNLARSARGLVEASGLDGIDSESGHFSNLVLLSIVPETAAPLADGWWPMASCQPLISVTTVRRHSC